ncbi:MAG: thymidine phosphorylase [Oscillospiraceae bacterium]|nr:thymidine phosphorylase [Ruminococcus sp.]MCD8344614.1 thymidine phosphorylase [Oscillospiraceae bacterium]
MTMYDIILKKRRGYELSDEEIKFAIDGFTDGSIPDYQMSALAMAICFNSMTDRETATLTFAMADSGDQLDLSEFGNMTCDKHSTGGVGDKTSLIVAPLVASCGGVFAKMSGRGLGHTGGTIDKLESIRGYRTELSEEEFLEQTRNIGICVIGQTGNMTPADKKLYALRDVTATVDSIPLIASSVMSKKLAAGAKSIVLDVKAGSGAFMSDAESAKVLAEKMVEIGRRCGRNVSALITNMDMPLGKCVGNSLEVLEAISVLKGETKGDLRELCLELASTLLSMCHDISHEAARKMAENSLESGAAFEKFKQWISAQGGNADWADNTDLFPKAKCSLKVKATTDGIIQHMNTAQIGRASSSLGAGRMKKGDPIDLEAGIIIEKKTGDEVKKGEVLATLYSNKQETLQNASIIYVDALSISDDPVEKPKLIFDRV